MKKIKFIIMINIFTIIYLILNIYNYFNIKRVLNLNQENGLAQIVLLLIFIVLGSFFIINQFIKRKYYIFFINVLGNIWLGIISIGFSVFIILNLLELIFTRSINYNIYLYTIIPLVMIIYSFINGLRVPNIKNVEINQSIVEDFTICQLSDIHINKYMSENWLRRVVEKTNELNPDIIVITGDLIDDPFKEIEKYAESLKLLKAKYGVYAIIGNHEVYTGIDEFKKILKRADIKLLENEKVNIRGDINLIGIDNYKKKTYFDNSTDPIFNIKNINEELNSNDYNILLEHEPNNFEEVSKLKYNLQLSGHTHKGQIPPLNFLVGLRYKYYYGLNKLNGKNIYTSSGTGYWGPPMRLFSKGEVVNIKVKSEY